MGTETKIEWTDKTLNPWRGCQKVAEGCKFCYADKQAKRNPGTLGIWGPNGTRVVASESMWREPVKWDRDAAKDGERYRVFCASMADVFEDWDGECLDHTGAAHYTRDGNPNEMVRNEQMRGSDSDGYHYTKLPDVRARLFNLIDATPNLDWQLLTKRPENIPAMVPDYSYHACVTGDCPHWLQSECDPKTKFRDNVWLGTSIACQDDADRNVPLLLKCRDLAPVLFLSCEPLIGPVDLHLHDLVDDRQKLDFINWVIVGGESGHSARPCDIAWIRSIVRQCKDAGVPCFVKQLGARAYDGKYTLRGHDHPTEPMLLNLQDPKGGDWNEWPADLRVREFPEVRE